MNLKDEHDKTADKKIAQLYALEISIPLRGRLGVLRIAGKISNTVQIAVQKTHSSSIGLFLRMASILKEQLIKLELLLLKPEIRASEKELDRLIADEFLEFGSSGIRFGKKEVMVRLPDEVAPEIMATDFELREITPNVAQLVYKASMKKHSKNAMRYSLRSSIWKLNGSEWQMVFHQGTPCAPF